ncbi:phosphodiester glycosidase family protein [Bacillus rhizoplanae]|uniref:phosphodiester glycosidase family protein n=1 Tax=Bacillus rhizoplanae TaxID=2880966 RepID=UPI003D2140BE
MMKKEYLSIKIRQISIVWLVVFYVVSMLASTVSVPVYAAESLFQTVKEDGFTVGPGVVHKSLTVKNETHIEAVNMIEVDPSNPHIKLEVTSPKGKVVALDTVRNQAKQIDREGNRVIAGFNMDFYNTDPNYAGVPNGLQITQGEVITAPVSTQSALAVMADGGIKIAKNLKMTGTILNPANGQERTVDGVNRPRTESASNNLYLYTSKFNSTTKSAGAGVEVVINPSNTKLEANKVLTGKVEAVYETNNTAIPDGKWVLSATGDQAAWVKENFFEGKEVQINIQFNEDFNNAAQAVSGGAVLVENGKPTEQALNDDKDRHPRTFVASKQGKLHVITFDGRQPTYSDGVTLAEGAKYLAELGMETAINVDGGGSTTYTARMPGDQTLSVLNSPSDGYERSNSNSLMIVSTAPVSDLAYLVPVPKGPLKVLANGVIDFSAKGQDQYFNGVPVDTQKLTFAVDGAIGNISSAGKFTASNTAGQGNVNINLGAISQSVPVEVVNELSSIKISPNPVIVNPGQKQTFNVKGYDQSGNEIIVSPNLLKWEVTGNIGTISPNGELTAVNETATGSVIVSYGSTKAEVAVSVGKPPVVIEDFEDLNDLYVSSARANSVSLDLMSRSKPVRVGTHSARLSYDFTGTIGTSAAYVNFKGADGNIGRELEGRPSKLGLWVYGDEKNHWLRAVIQDGNGKNIPLSLTGAGELNWEGWKYVSVDIPSDTVTPIKLRQIYVVETSNSNKNKGAVYFDHLRAIYSDTGEDLIGPVFSDVSPAKGKRVYTNTPDISAVVKDEGKGVDTGSLKMMIDGNVVQHQYDATTGKISYKPSEPLADGEHHVVIDGMDIAGNPALPKADWKFVVYTGDDLDKPEVTIISPADGITTRTNQPRIAAKLFDEYKGIDVSKIQMTIDDKDVPFQYDEASGTVYYMPRMAWENGTNHKVKVTAVDKSNNETVQTWSYTIGSPLGQPKKQNHFQMSVIGDGGYYTAGQGQTAADILLREQINRINQEPSELIGYTGDIVENDTAENFATGLANMNLFKMPYIVSIGNHEISGTNSRLNYQKTFGEPTYMYDYGNTRIIGLDSANGGLTNSDASQWPWLQEVLANNNKKNVLVFMHVPPDEISPDGEDYNTGHGFSNREEAQKFYDMMGAYKQQNRNKNIVVLSGDLHAYQHKNVQGVDYIISGGGGKYTHIPPEKGGFYHYLNLKIEANTISWDVIPLLDSISFSADSVTVETNAKVKLEANGKFMTSTNTPITLPIAPPFKTEWKSSNEKVASVDDTGTVTALSPGEAVITVKSGWREGQIKLIVPDSPAKAAVIYAAQLANGDLTTQEKIMDAYKAISSAEDLVKVLPNSREKSDLIKRISILKEIVNLNQRIYEIQSAAYTSAESIDQGITNYEKVDALMKVIPDETERKLVKEKLIQAEVPIVQGIKVVLEQQEKMNRMKDTWLRFVVTHGIHKFNPADESGMQQVYGYIKDIVKEHATDQEIKAAIQKYMKHDKNI